ncbi:conjugal transfer protein [Ahniella affigens]|uniref:Conjugal transfer protein n=1 Tax=Ahniella affigens TaxID=2021234 RepID=A0A2P1PW85_9GAMM|nr:conjugative transfer system coupling protein TraD [Ahniella affigens]AVP99096.1 conjugal transfer protein [Ahniella affigens]
MNRHDFDDPFRPMHEAWRVSGWLALAVGLWTLTRDIPIDCWQRWLPILAWALAIRDLPACYRLRRQQRLLNGQALRFHDLAALQGAMRQRPDAIWLGHGYVWAQATAQRAATWLDHWQGQSPQAPQHKGLPWLHGLAGIERPVYLPLSFARGHTLVVGTTGAGKTRLLDNLIAQAILRDEAVIIIDPKGDHELAQIAERVCAMRGEADRYRPFLRAHPERSICLDPLHHFSDAAQLASRVAGLIQNDGGSDVFVSFAQKTLMIIIEAMLLLEQRPTLSQLLRYVDGGVEPLLHELLNHLTGQFAPASDADSVPELLPPPGQREAVGHGKTQKPNPNLLRFRALQPVLPARHRQAVEALLAHTEHDPQHARKLLASLSPLLHQLCTPDLARLISPDANTDGKPVHDFATLIQARKVVYVGLDSLSDPIVASALGSLLMADLSALAGNIYQHGKADVPISCYIDEASECVHEATIALLNKGRGAGFALTLLTQTFADFVVATGSDAKAKQVLANTNNLICLRVQDTDTQRYVADKVPTAPIRRIEWSQSSGAMQDTSLAYATSAAESLSTEVESLLPPALLGGLPDLEGFAQLAGGEVYKFIFPILRTEPRHGTTS